jgi:hypothetical protein
MDRKMAYLNKAKTMAALALILASTSVSAEPVTIDSLLEKTNVTEDVTYAGTAIARCTAHYMVMADHIPQFEEAALVLFEIGGRIRQNKADERGTEYTLDQWATEVTRFGEFYGARLQNNNLQYGNMYEDDAWLQQDIKACNILYSALKD